jgi:hypothetical protein
MPVMPSRKLSVSACRPKEEVNLSDTEASPDDPGDALVEEKNLFPGGVQLLLLPCRGGAEASSE